MDWIRDSMAGISWLIAHSGTVPAAVAAEEVADAPLAEWFDCVDEQVDVPIEDDSDWSSEVWLELMLFWLALLALLL